MGMAMIEFEEPESVQKAMTFKYPFFGNKEIVVQDNPSKIPPPKFILDRQNSRQNSQKLGSQKMSSQNSGHLGGTNHSKPPLESPNPQNGSPNGTSKPPNNSHL